MNLYECLGIQPTLDHNEIRKAYREKLMACHPDKNPNGEEECKLIIKAWEVLQDGVSRQRYYAEITGQNIQSNQESFSSWVHQEEVPLHSSEENSNSLVSPGVKIKVYIAIYPSHSASECSGQRIYAAEFTHTTQTLFEKLARRITNTLDNGKTFIQVGVDEREHHEIVEQHSWWKHYGNYGYVIAWVRLIDIESRKTEEDIAGPCMLNARNYKAFFSLKPKTQFVACDFIHFYMDRGPLRNMDSYFLPNPEIIHFNENCNPKVRKPIDYNHELMLFLHDSDFWSRQVHRAWHSYPSGVIEMQRCPLINNRIDLIELQRIAARLCETNELTSLFTDLFRGPRDAITKEFYRVVRDSRSINEIYEWIQSKIQIPQNQLLIKNSA